MAAANELVRSSRSARRFPGARAAVPSLRVRGPGEGNHMFGLPAGAALLESQSGRLLVAPENEQ